jgi:hypothetical protein
MNLNSTPRPNESTQARNSARLFALGQWLPVDEWLAIVETARYLDARATHRGWINLRRDPWRQIPSELPDDFYRTVADLHAHLTRRGVKATPAIAALADVSDQIADLWLYVAEQRGLIDLKHPSVDHLRRSTRRKESHV